ncbi:hypothetical protein [Streptomyces sp. NPDC101132]|uniref:hypothetical protein n=1 Tax=Streptomyces sp. NPDC101132 TaxID=3366110 RepID=UPI00380CFD8A
MGRTPRTRFHLDQDGHSVSVLLERAGGHVEVLVDGKVVRQGRAPKQGVTVLRAELPGQPPRPVAVTLGNLGGDFLCELDVEGDRHPMPRVPLVAPGGARPTGRPHPLRLLRRSYRRVLRRMVAHQGRHRPRPAA